MTKKEFDTAKEILDYVIYNTQNNEVKIECHYQLMKMAVDKAQPSEYLAIKSQYDALLQEFGSGSSSINLQVAKAHFEAFYLKNFELAKSILTKALELPLNAYQKASVKIELADVLLLDEKFNQAIIYYAQVESDLENDEVAHEASLKMAKASYFKGDFDWAQKQFKGFEIVNITINSKRCDGDVFINFG